VGCNEDEKDKRVLFSHLFTKFINFQGGSEEEPKLFALVALKTIEKDNCDNFTDEQIQLLRYGANLPHLPQNKEKNKDAIDMVRRFVRDKALNSEHYKISFEDIMPKDIKHETCQELLDFVEKFHQKWRRAKTSAGNSARLKDTAKTNIANSMTHA
jgi:hypothetical protein